MRYKNTHNLYDNNIRQYIWHDSTFQSLSVSMIKIILNISMFLCSKLFVLILLALLLCES